MATMINKNIFKTIVADDITCKQLFNKNKISSGSLVSVTTGELATNAAYGTSDYIPVKAGVNYYQQGTNVWYSVLYDEDYNFVSQINSKSFAPSQNGYIRTSFLLTDIDKVQVEAGIIPSDVIPHKTFGMESGTNYLKFDDGTLICTGKKYSTAAVNIAVRNIYRSDTINLDDYPVQFKPGTNPRVIKFWENATWARQEVYTLQGWGSASNSNPGDVRLVGASSVTNVAGYIVYIAIGYWK